MRWSAVLIGCLLLLARAQAPATAAPDEELLGKSAGYPVGTARTWFREEGVRVGSFSHLDRILPHNVLAKAAQPLPLVVAAGELKVDYRFESKTLTLDDFLARQRITGLLIIKDGQVLLERYQYDRSAAHRFVSHSIAKSLTSLAVGLAMRDKFIASLDDAAAKYEPKLAGSAYGETSIRDLLRMASGVRFNEVYDGRDDITKFEALRVTAGTIEAARTFGEREAKAGARFHYASSETAVLAVVLRGATGRTLAAYLTERLWQPMGAEAEATWIKSADGFEKGGWGFNATLRDYARLGVLLANDGALGGRQILPRDFLSEATDWHKHPEAFAPRRATPYFGYGYQFWTFPGETRRFALLGVYGQSIFVDPGLKLVMVITAAAKTASVGKESLAVERDVVWRALVLKFGSW
jgi:CubicO group peptidase (beta-lactamase class C family)